MPPLNASQLGAWERRFARSREDLEPMRQSDGMIAREELSSRTARVRKARRLRTATTPKITPPRKLPDRIEWANNKKVLLGSLASDCGCELHPKGCYHALLERYKMGVLDDIIHWRLRTTSGPCLFQYSHLPVPQAHTA